MSSDGMNIMKHIPRVARIIAILAIAALPCLAAEVAVLKNGFSITHERREVIGQITRLYVKADGSSYVDVPTAQIEHFEAAPEDTPSSSGVPSSTSSLSPAFTRTTTSLSFPGRPVSDLNQVINEASGRYRLDPDLVNSVIKAESDFHVRAVSPKGAQGLMQLMPGTASQLGVENAFDPQANVDGGTRYLRELLEKYNFDLVKALAAYNAGPQRVERFGGVPPYTETKLYIRRIVLDFNKKKAAQQKAQAAKANAPKRAETKAPAKVATSHPVEAKSGPGTE